MQVLKNLLANSFEYNQRILPYDYYILMLSNSAGLNPLLGISDLEFHALIKV